MAKTDAFYFKFRWILLLTFFTGTYIPGITRLLPKHFPALSLFTFFLALVSYNGFDYFFKLVLDSDELDFIMKFVMHGAVLAYLWAILTAGFVYIRRREIQELIIFWCCNFEPELWPELRLDAIKTQKKKSWMKIKEVFLYYVFPVGIFQAISVYNGDLLMASMFVHGQTKVSNRFVVFMQCFGYWCFLWWYSMMQCFLAMMLRLVLAELEYVESAFSKVLSSIKIRTDGSIYTVDDPKLIGAQLTKEDNRKLCHIAEEKICKLIKYHIKILKFSKKINPIIGPIFASQFTVVSAFVSVIGYGTTTGALTSDLAIILGTSIGYWCYLCYITCAIGGQVQEKSSRFVDAAFHANWMVYSVRIQKLLLPVIAVAKQRPITVNPMGIVPMIPETFFTLTSFQYKLIRFIADTLQK